MPLLPKGYTGASIGDAPIFAGRRASAQDFGATGPGESGLVEAGHRVTATAKAELSSLEGEQSRKAVVDTSEIHAEFARKLDEAALSGADTGKLKEEMRARLEKVGEGFTTKAGLDQLRQQAANAEIRFDQQANQIKVQRAWSTAQTDTTRLVNAAAVHIQRDGSALGAEVAKAHAYIDTYPGIRPDQREKLKADVLSDLHMTAAVSASRMYPEETLARLKAGEWELSPQQREQAVGKAEQEIRAKKVEENVRRAEEKARKEADALAAYDEHSKAVWEGTFSRRKILDDARFAAHPQYRTQVLNLAESRANAASERPIRTNPTVFNDLRERIDLPITDPRALRDPSEIWKGYTSRNLTESNAQTLERRLRDNRTESGQKFAALESEFLRNMKPRLDKSTMLSIDQEGGARVQAFTQHVRDRVEAYRKEKKDPAALLNPNSKEYLGNDIPLFQTAAQRMSDRTARQVDQALGGEPRPSLDDLLGPKK